LVAHCGKYRLAKSGTDPIEKQKADYLEILDTYKKIITLLLIEA
jgi:hypothetical protein